MLYLITHGMRDAGGDPSNTMEGLMQFDSDFVKTVLACIDGKNPPFVLVGDGKRFLETYRFIKKMGFFCKAPVKYSLICGNATSRRDRRGNSLVILSNERPVLEKNYISLSDLKNVDWWQCFIKTLPDRVVLIAGRQLMRALGAKECSSCSVYTLCPKTKSIKCWVRHSERAKQKE